ncbi:hypothetical protein [Saccharothrix xinjiangensis]|uniref:Oxidoreductase n=1 Tax=Saccharothrix xinjiangensis TaxID=204798 RepID=A0ABV9YFV3_9PSEU
MLAESRLTKAERALVEAVRSGAVLEGGNEIRAELIRDLLLGRHVDRPDPRGVQLSGARVVGALDLDFVQSPVRLRLADCEITEIVTARSARLSALDLDGSRLPAFHADRLRVDGNAFLRGVVANTDHPQGAVRLTGAHIAGNFEANGAVLTCTRGPAFMADGLHVDLSVFLRRGFTAHSDDHHGTVRLIAARVDGDLDLNHSTITNSAASAVSARGAQVGGNVYLADNFTASGAGPAASVVLHSANIGGMLLVSGELSNPGGPVLDLVHTRSTSVYLDDRLLCAETCDGRRKMRLAGFTYASLDHTGWERWLHWIRHHTVDYAAQPYQQLAAVQRAAGHDAAARRVLITQQEDLRDRGDLRSRPWGKLAHRAWGVVGGYGYRAGRTAVALLVVLLMAGAAGVAAGQVPTSPGHYAAERTKNARAPHTPCSLVEQVGLGIDRGLPLGATGLRDRCDLNTATRQGQAFTVLIWLLQGAVWALATLAVAGYTGLIRKIT